MVAGQGVNAIATQAFFGGKALPGGVGCVPVPQAVIFRGDPELAGGCDDGFHDELAGMRACGDLAPIGDGIGEIGGDARSFLSNGGAGQGDEDECGEGLAEFSHGSASNRAPGEWTPGKRWGRPILKRGHWSFVYLYIGWPTRWPMGRGFEQLGAVCS